MGDQPRPSCDDATPRGRAAALARWIAGGIARHRILQFALIGGLLFAVAPRPRPPRDIEISGARLAALREAEAGRADARKLAPEIGAEVDQRLIEDELLYREGVRLGLQDNDGIVRQRVVQKVLFLAEEAAGATRPPSDEELRAFFEKNRDRWSFPERTRFVHVHQHRREALAAWAAGPQSGEPPAGEPSPVPPEFEGDAALIARTLGAGFAEGLASAAPGRWAGPVPSAFGWHLVRVIERTPARPARLEEVRAAVVEAYGLFRRQEATAAFVAGAFARYRVTIDGVPVRSLDPSRRVAFRASASGED